MAYSRARRLLVTSAAGVAQRLVQMASSLVTLPLALHALGVAGFGVWGAATSLLWLTGLLTFGLGSALVTLLPAGLAGGDHEANRAHVTAALFGGAVVAVLLALGGAGVIMSGDVRFGPPFEAAALALSLNVPLSIGPEIWFALQKGHVAALWGIVQTLLALAGLIVGVWLGAGITALVWVFYGALLISNGGCLAHVLAVHHTLRPLRRVSLPALRRVLGQSGLLSLVTAAGMGVWVFDNIMALSWLGTGASAQMALAMRVCTTAGGLIAVFAGPFWPGFAEALAMRDHDWVRKALWRGMAATSALSLGGAVLIVMFGRSALNFWMHQDLRYSPWLFWAMAGWIVAQSLLTVPAALLNAANVLWPQIGLFTLLAVGGLAAKYMVAHSGYVVAHQWALAGILSVSPILWLSCGAPWLVWQAVSALERMKAN
jgi:O-antigen/teichoic acid export membrane protein